MTILVEGEAAGYARAVSEPAARPPRVLHVITRLNVGGVARNVLALTVALRANGFETLIAYGTPEPGEGEVPPGVEPSIRIAALRRPLDPSADQRAITELTRLITRYRPDVVHTHTAKAGALGRSAARRMGVSGVVHTFHGHVLEGYFPSPANAAFVAAERRLAKRTDRLVAVSVSTRDELLALGIGRPERWCVMPYALDVGPLARTRLERSDARRILGLPDDVPVVGIVGRLVPIKNHDMFLRAAVRIAAERPDAVFAVAGDGELRSFLEAEAEQSLGPGRVRFLGWVGDLAALYVGLDVIVLTSLNEGTPVALIEAGAAGRPVVSTDVGGVAEVVVEGETGFLVPPEDDEELAVRVLQLLGDSALAARMGETARLSLPERYSADQMGREMAELYREVLAGR